MQFWKLTPIYQMSMPSLATPAHFFSILILNGSQSMGVAIEGIDIWNMGITVLKVEAFN